jgi:hypothetical protein
MDCPSLKGTDLPFKVKVAPDMTSSFAKRTCPEVKAGIALYQLWHMSEMA